MVTAALKSLVNVSRPGQTPEPEDTVEIECVGGFVCEVDPVTRTTRETHQRFVLGTDGVLKIVKR